MLSLIWHQTLKLYEDNLWNRWDIEHPTRHLDAILPPPIQMLLVTLDYDQGLRPGPPFAVDEAQVRALYEPAYAVELLYSRDALAENSAWRAQGLTWLHETVYRLARRGP